MNDCQRTLSSGKKIAYGGWSFSERRKVLHYWLFRKPFRKVASGNDLTYGDYRDYFLRQCAGTGEGSRASIKPEESP